ncbi:MAG: ABC transporter ATP-binding protein/permease [Lachnospiraceae bacterium]|nr:ABC transporter ATP-binding protein/permease [Lachnospiraceae bacterium]
MLQVITQNLKEYKKDALITPIFMILEVIVDIVIPLMMASIVDHGVEDGNLTHIYVMGGCMIGTAILGLFFGMAGGHFAARGSAGLAKNIRARMYGNIQTFSFANIDKFSTAGLVTRLTTDITNIQNAFQMAIRMGFRAPFSMLFAMIMAFLINARLASIYLVAVAFLAGFIVLLMGSATKYFKATFEKYDELNSSVQENVSSIRVVKAFVREEYEKDKFHRAVSNLYQMFVGAEKKVVLAMPVMMTTVYACILMLSWLGAKMIVTSGQTELTTGQLMNLMTYCMNILMNLMMLSMMFVMLTMSSASLNRVKEVLEEKPDIVNPEDPVMDVKDGSIEFSHVNFSYQAGSEKNVLSDINFTIQPGETIGIMGGTGSSKTSLVNLISRLYDVTDGCVKVGGVDVRKYDLTVLRDEVSVVLQKNVLFSGTILDNLRWGNPDATEEECMRACQLACADEFIEKMPKKYETYIEQGGNNVSGGQKQRLCIARALLKQPKILILDDSTSAVDTATDQKIRKAFATEIPNTTKIIISQRISSLQDADRILVLDDGEVKGFDTHEHLLAGNDIYRDVYEAQTQGSGDFDEKGGEA